MPHLSSKKVRKDIFLRMNERFINSVARIKNSQESKRFLNEILTPSEKIMLSKRLALLFMLESGYSFTAIRKNLKLSQSTIVRFWKMFKRDRFPFIKFRVQEEKKRKEFWGKFERIVNAGLPPRGRGR